MDDKRTMNLRPLNDNFFINNQSRVAVFGNSEIFDFVSYPNII